jgi:hypothetical protein
MWADNSRIAAAWIHVMLLAFREGAKRDPMQFSILADSAANRNHGSSR